MINLKQIREERNIKLQTLQFILNIDIKRLQDIEEKKIYPRFIELLDLCNFYGIPLTKVIELHKLNSKRVYELLI